MNVTKLAQARMAAALLAGAIAALPGLAHANAAAVDYFRGRADRSAVPALLSQDERAYYKDLFAAIDKGDWTRVQAMFAQKADGPLHAVAKAEYYLAPGSPRIELDALNQWLATGVGLPQAEQIAALAAKRGAAALPPLPPPMPWPPYPAGPSGSARAIPTTAPCPARCRRSFSRACSLRCRCLKATAAFSSPTDWNRPATST